MSSRYLTVLLLLCFCLTTYSQTMSPTGFYYPLGKPLSNSNVIDGQLKNYASWLSGSPFRFTPEGYFSNEYHLGIDQPAKKGTPVVCMATGVVKAISYNGWGTNNVAVIITSRTGDGVIYEHLSGHLLEESTKHLKVGCPVYAGSQLGIVGDWPDGHHVHVGIALYPGFVPGYGRGGSPSDWSKISLNNQVNPQVFIATYSPWGPQLMDSYNTSRRDLRLMIGTMGITATNIKDGYGQDNYLVTWPHEKRTFGFEGNFFKAFVNSKGKTEWLTTKTSGTVMVATDNESRFNVSEGYRSDFPTWKPKFEINRNLPLAPARRCN